MDLHTRAPLALPGLDERFQLPRRKLLVFGYLYGFLRVGRAARYGVVVETQNVLALKVLPVSVRLGGRT